MVQIAGAQVVPSLDDLIKQGIEEFEKIFQAEATVVGFSPGRVNLIGDHVDYNDGLVLPMAIPVYTVVIGAPNSFQICRIESLSNKLESPKRVELKFDSLTIGPPSWSNYVKGVISTFPGIKKPFDALILSSIPIGAGLSSSAALEVAFFNFLQGLSGSDLGISKQEIALLCQNAEHTFAGVPCGIMDQFVVVMGKKDHALLIDCRSLSTELVPLVSDDIVILVANSNIRHELAGSEYSSRRKNCEQVAQMLGKSSLRDVSMKELETSQTVLPLEQYQYSRHVITEIERALSASEALKKSDYVIFGALMTQSHCSLRDDYKVSVPEIDELCEIALESEGVYGSRITGGGFGGCTVTLVSANKVESTINNMMTKSRISVDFYVFKPAEGASYKSLPSKKSF